MSGAGASTRGKTGGSAEVVIAGGGAIGSAVACFLALDPDFDGRVVVVDPDPSGGASSSARSLGGIRFQYSTPENVRMSRFGAALAADPGRWLSVDGEAPSLSYVPGGYLFLASAPGWEALRENVAVQRAEGVETILLEPDALAERFPWLGVEGLAGGALGAPGEGWVDPHSLMHALRRKAVSLGVSVLATRVSGVEVTGARVRAVRLASGERLACATLVDAAGPRAAEIARMAGVELPVRPRKRQVFVFECRERVAPCPLTIDPSGLFFRPEGAFFLCGRSPAPDADPDTTDLAVDEAQFEDELWPLLAARVPAFEAIRMARAWAGLYEYNTLDQNAIIGAHPEIANLLFANGFSGHGLQQSPAAGRAVAELIVHGRFRTLDLARLGYARVAAGEPLRERNIV
jgi:sarcosine oxidase